jgi:UDP-glucose 4-epimerase
VETSLNDLANGLLRAMGSNLSVEYGPERKVNPVPRRLAETRTAADAIGFRSTITLEEGLARLVEWWRAEQLAGAVNA